MGPDWLRRQAKRLTVWLVALLVVTATGGIVYFSAPLHGTDTAIADVESSPDVTVTQQDETYVLEPADSEPSAGLVFYPGGRVHPDAYLAALAPLAAEANVRVVVVKLPLNLAVLDQNAADQYVEGSSLDWYVGGHSLGGAMACRYARANPDAVEGLVLFASYCDRDISETGLAVVSVTGSADSVLDRSTYEDNRDNLPPNATVRELQGLNHSQFGHYRGQPDDEASPISYDRAHDRLGNVTVPWFRTQR